MSDRERGVYGKFTVARNDGSSAPGGKHADCTYYVLDLNHDPHAMPALRAYADSCAAEYPALAADLREIANTRPCGCRSPGDCQHTFSPQTPNEAMADKLRGEERG